MKEIKFVRNDYEGSVSIKPDRMSGYKDLFPGGVVPKSAPQFFFLTSTSFDPETEFEKLNAGLDDADKVKLIIENDAKIWENLLEKKIDFQIYFDNHYNNF